MPGTAMHHMIAERLKALIRQKRGLGKLTDAEYEQLNTLLDDPKNQAYLFLGAQGPDFFFFNVEDWPQPVRWLLDKVLDVTDFIDDFRREVLKLVPDEEIMEALSAVDGTLEETSSLYASTKDLLTRSKELLDGLLATATEAAKAYGTDLINPFNLIGHPYRDGIDQDADEWWWFDSLHYRKTGQFAETLLKRAPLDSPLHLYALGYLTHVAADTVGHAYVNLNSGGPYRSQAQRHRTGENFQDVFNYNISASSTVKNLGRSQLHALYNFEYDGTITPVDDLNTQPPNTGRFPEDLDLEQNLGGFIASAINAIYNIDQSAPGGPDFGDPISADDVRRSYKLWYKWWRSTTESGTIPAPRPYSYSAEVSEMVERLGDNLGSIGDFLGDAADNAGNGGILGLLAFLAALFIAAIGAALALIDFVLGMLTEISTAGIKIMISIAYEQVYAAYQYFRLMVALNGLALPLVESVNEPVLQQFKNPSARDSTLRNAADLLPYMPLLRWHEALNVAESHLTYPYPHRHRDSGLDHGENEGTTVAPYSYLGQHSSFYAWGPLTTNGDAIGKLMRVHDEHQPDFHEAEMRNALWGAEGMGKGEPLGSALTLTEWLYDRWQSGRSPDARPEEHELPDFNLDSDRGYGYLVWRQPKEDQNTPTRLPIQPKSDDAQDVADAIENIVTLTIIDKDDA